MTLPPLPAPARSVVYNESKGYGFYAYTAAQMENYARAVLADDPWHKLYRRAINEANGLTNYVEDRPELRGAERRLAAIEAEARTLAAALEPTPEKKP